MYTMQKKPQVSVISTVIYDISSLIRINSALPE